MISRDHRYSFKSGAPKFSFQTPFFVFRYQPNVHASYRVGVVVSKKINKFAVKRNVLKRTYLKILRELIEKNALKLDIIIYVRKAGADISREEIRAQLEQVLSRNSTIQK